MNATKRTPQLRFPEFTGEWREKRLGEIFLFKRTNSLSRAQLDIRGVVKNIHYGDIHTKFPTVLDSTRDDISYIRSSVGDNVGDFLYDGDLVVADASEDYNDIGKTVEISGVDNNEVKIVAGLHTLALSPYSNYANGFMGYLFKTESVHRQMVRVATGVSVLGLSKSNVSDMCLLVPPLEEQQKIAAFLAAVDKRVALLERKVQQLEAYKRGVMQQLFSQQLRFTRPDGSHFPAWQEKRLGEVFDAARGSSLSWGDIEADGKNKAILYGQLYTIYPEVVSQVVSRTNSNKGTPSKNGDLLLPNSTTTTGIDLANATALNEDGVLLGGDITILRFKETGSSIFYAYYLSHFMKYKLAAYGQGSTIVHMYFSQYKNMKIVEPSAAEQQKIAEVLSALDEKIALTRQQLDKTKQFKKGLLQRMFV